MLEQINWGRVLGLTMFIIGAGSSVSKLIKRWKDKSQQLREVQKIYEEIRKEGINWESLLKQKQPKTIIFQNIKPKINPDTLKIFKREQNILYENMNNYYDHIFGGCLIIKSQQWKNFFVPHVRCEINDTTIFRSSLIERQTPIKIFQENKYLPQFKRYEAVLSNTMKLTLMGTLTYNIETKQFILETTMISKSTQEILDWYKSQKQSAILLTFFFVLFCGSVVAYFIDDFLKLGKFIKKKIKSKVWPQLMQEQPLQEEYFKNLNVTADPIHQMKCYKCKNKITNIILECGHLVICETCQQKAEEGREIIRCPLCNKESTKIIKIFIS